MSFNLSTFLSKKAEFTPYPPATNTYHINLDDRGSFSADVRNSAGTTVFDIKAGDELPKGDSDIFEDGFMQHKHDMDSLKDYLVQLGIMKPQQFLKLNPPLHVFS